MDQVHHIRELFYQQGKNLSEIANELHCDWRTVKKYVDKEDFNQPPPVSDAEKKHGSKLDPFKEIIDKWLIDDQKAPRKQRHTAKRVYDRLCKETDGFNASYRLVAEYVAIRKKELRIRRNDGFFSLIHRPGEAQADFGTADFYENDKLHKEAKYLVLSFPFSNGGYLQLNYGENMECLLESLQAIFEYIGGVPSEIWFDNTRTIVTEIIRGGGRKINERFQLFAEHYRFKPVFMNPASGNEKGNVENKVGYLRRNELVPVPHFDTLKEANENLFAACDADMEREHYENEGSFISEMFIADKEALLPLPTVRFDTARYISRMTDNYGKFTMPDGKHTYSSSPAYARTSVNLKLTSHEVIVMDADMHEIVRHRRLYGDEQQEAMNWIPYLKYIARKPRSLRNSGIYDMMPESMRFYLDNCRSVDRGRILKVLAELTNRTGFESALKTVDQAISYQATDPDSLRSLYRRLYSDVPLLPPLRGSRSIPKTRVIPMNTDLDMLDRFLLKRGAANE